MFTLPTPRLTIRPFELTDLDAIHGILDIELADVNMGSEGAQTLESRRAWLDWTVRNYTELAKLYQPPYGDRAIILRETGELIGAVGFVQSFGPFGQLPYFQKISGPSIRFTPEFGLYYALSPRHQRRGYATEAVQAMLAYGFTELNLRRIIATTTYDNLASQGVMRKVGMTIEKNPYPDPPWFQVVGILENPGP